MLLIKGKKMKKFLALMLVMSFVVTNSQALAITPTTTEEVKAPVWEEYVPEKYQNPRSFPNKGKNIAELAVGIVLTDLLITAPIGIPMICHSTTKMKNQGWFVKRQKFEAGLEHATTISDPAEKQAYYVKLKKECGLTEEKHQKQLRKMQKKAKKSAK